MSVSSQEWTMRNVRIGRLALLLFVVAAVIAAASINGIMKG
jgi:hypothetical protein